VAPEEDDGGDERPIGGRGRYSTKGTLKAIGNKTDRVDDNDIILRAVARITKARSDAELDAAVEEIHQGFVDSNSGASGRATRWNLLFKEWLVVGSATLEKVMKAKKMSLMANAGNANARNATDEEIDENNESIAPLYQLPAGTMFWLLDMKQDFPAAMPPRIVSPNPNHGGASYRAYRLKYGMVRSRVTSRDCGDKVYDRRASADRPPAGWAIEIVGKHSMRLSRATAGGSRFVLVKVKE
jgi:hypothetical protein